MTKPSFNRRGALLPGLGLILGLLATSLPSQAITFSSFVDLRAEFSTDYGGGDGYPGRMQLLNHTNRANCVFVRFRDANGTVLRLSLVGKQIAAGRKDLAVKGPGESSRSVEVFTAEPHSSGCGRISGFPSDYGTTVRPGEIKQGRGIEVDARSWSGNSRDITVNLR
jgi:hypothetical protein